MEEEEAAIVAVAEHVTVDQAENWFNAVCDAYVEGDEDWDAFVTRLTETAAQASFSPEVVETFVRVVDEQVSDRWTVLRTMSENRTELPGQYEQILAQWAAGGEGAEAEEVVAWDQETAAQWYEYLGNESSQGGWSGSDEDWDAFRQTFLEAAEPHDVAPQATVFLDGIEAHGSGKIAALAEFGITILGYEESTGLYYDEAGNRYRRDSAGVDYPLQWTDSNLWWVQVDGEDYWYDENLQPYDGSEAAAEAESTDEARADEEQVQAVARINNDVVESLVAANADLVEQAGGQEVFEQLVAQVLHERVLAASNA